MAQEEDKAHQQKGPSEEVFKAKVSISRRMNTENVAPAHNGILSASQKRGLLSPEIVWPNLKGIELHRIGQTP